LYFALNSYADTSELAKRVQVLPVNCGRMHFGQVHIIKLKGVSLLAEGQTERGLPLKLDSFKFGQEELQEAILAYCIENDEKDSKMAMTKTPENFQLYSLHGWNTFNRELENYLSGIKGISGV